MTPQKVVKPMEELSPIISGLVETGTDVTITVTGNSMSPLWHHKRDNVVLTKCNPDFLKKGDVPLYRRLDGRYVLHRIVRVHNNTFDLAGDAQSVIEKGLPKTAVIAVVKGFYRNDRLVLSTNRRYKIYHTLWRAVLPIRHYIFKLYGMIRGKKK
ncbi:MAG: S24/S26 family peptidase [Oscillospiraceae bacterium]